MTIHVQPEPLTQGAFAPFGDVIETAERDVFMINQGNTRRYHKLAEVQTGPADGRAIISIFQAWAHSFPLRIRMLERHPHGSQAFIPMRGQPYLIVVAPAGDEPDVRALRAFIAHGNQGINYHPGTWHHPVLALAHQDDFLVVDRAGDIANCDEHYFPEQLDIQLYSDSLTA
ncbi:MAG: ureidoglycolate lyase [Natronospirillum sp.]